MIHCGYGYGYGYFEVAVAVTVTVTVNGWSIQEKRGLEEGVEEEGQVEEVIHFGLLLL